MTPNYEIKVASQSNPKAVAGSIAAVVRERGKAEIVTIGASALNQAIKAVAIARGYLAPSGYDLVMIPAFNTVEAPREEGTVTRTAIRLQVFSR